MTSASAPVQDPLPRPAAPVRLRDRRALWVLLACVVAGGAWVARARLAADTSNTSGEAPSTFLVARGPLSIQVVETGSIQAREQVVLKNEVEGQTTLLFLIPEGTVVKKGELLAQLDASRLEDERLEQQIKVQNAEAAFIRARETVEVQKSESDSNISKDALAVQFAKEDVRKYLEGDYPSQLKEAQARITLAEAEVKRAVEKLEWSRVLSREKYVSTTELEADELAERKARLDLELAQGALALLQNFTFQRTKTKLESDVEQTALSLERTKRKSGADMIQAAADLKAKETEYQRQQLKQKKIDGQIQKTKLYAPRDGLVVYATSQGGGGMRGMSAEPLAEGQAIRERQELIKLPTADTMMAEVKIHESKLDKVRPGMAVRLTVDALPGREYTGKVVKIAPLPDAGNMWMNPDLKVYTTELHIDSGEGGLRTGMTCQAQILVAEYEDAVYVPVQAVLRQGAQALVWVRRAGRTGGTGRTEARPIEVGLDNNRMIHVRSGLEAGEEVLLAPPLDAGVKEPATPAGGAALTPSTRKVGTGAAPAAGGAAPAGAVPKAEAAPAGEAVAPAEGPGGAAGKRPRGGAGGSGGGGYGRMSPEEREAMRQRMEAMTPEEREKWREQMRNRRAREEEGGSGGGGGEGRPK